LPGATATPAASPGSGSSPSPVSSAIASEHNAMRHLGERTVPAGTR
jgi:hypothetical protein